MNLYRITHYEDIGASSTGQTLGSN